MDKAVRAKVNASQSSNGTTDPVTGDRELETGGLGCLLRNGEVVGLLLGEHIEVLDAFSNSATLAATADQLVHADRSPVNILPVVALKDKNDLVHFLVVRKFDEKLGTSYSFDGRRRTGILAM